MGGQKVLDKAFVMSYNSIHDTDKKHKKTRFPRYTKFRQ